MTLGRLHAILTNGIRLPRLVERLKHKDVVPPTDHATHRFLVILLSLRLPRLRVSVAAPFARPSGLSHPKLRHLAPPCSLFHVKVRCVHDGVSGAVLELVPTVGRANPDPWCRHPEVIHLGRQFRACKDGKLVYRVRLFKIRPRLDCQYPHQSRQSQRKGEASLPDTQNDLEALALGGGKNLLCRVTLICGVDTDELAARLFLDGLHVGLVVGLKLTAAICALGSKVEA
ncbi:hypothetical protein HYQ46_008773 [Verticillium longisporum]|nr:hypothetical protein HYQ46_008773 [Verticillium longisporum]